MVRTRAQHGGASTFPPLALGPESAPVDPSSPAGCLSPSLSPADESGVASSECRFFFRFRPPPSCFDATLLSSLPPSACPCPCPCP